MQAPYRVIGYGVTLCYVGNSSASRNKNNGGNGRNGGTADQKEWQIWWNSRKGYYIVCTYVLLIGNGGNGVNGGNGHCCRTYVLFTVHADDTDTLIFLL